MPQQANYTSFANLAANGSTSSVQVVSLDNEVSVYLGSGATWGSGTVKLQTSFDGGTTWLDVPNASWTSGSASTMIGKVTAYGSVFRLTLSGSTSPSLDLRMKVETVRFGNLKTYALSASGSTDTFILGDALQGFYGSNKDTADNIAPWYAAGTWGSGTLALQVSPDAGTTWFNIETLTANGGKVSAVTDQLARFTLSGATSPALSIFLIN